MTRRRRLIRPVRSPRELPVFIPRPLGARPGAPAPWVDRETFALDVGTVRRRLAPFTPQRAGEPADAGIRLSAVLIPLFGDRDVSVVLGKRSAHLPSHRGDISFPGGRLHPEDADLSATALREAHEEMGIDPSRVEVIGELDHLGTVATRFLIAPFVGIVDADPKGLVAHDGEVDRIILVPLRRLVEPGVYHQEIWGGAGPRMDVRGPEDPAAKWSGGALPEGPVGERPVNFFAIDEWDLIWGATATILRQFLDVVTSP